jgi:hypothetical protein
MQITRAALSASQNRRQSMRFACPATVANSARRANHLVSLYQKYVKAVSEK